MKRLRGFLGKSTTFNGVEVFSPTIDSISDIEEVQYNVNIVLATFDKEAVLKHIFGITDEKYSEIEKEDSYLVLLSIPHIIGDIEKAISFFIKSDVHYNEQTNSFEVDGRVFVNQSNYLEFASLIKKLNGIEDDTGTDKKFRNSKAKEMYEQMMKFKKKNNKKSNSESLELKDVLSILCNADGNGINVFNVGQLTIYQVYEHFEKANQKENHRRILQVWANGHLGEGEKLPEWMEKGKL